MSDVAGLTHQRRKLATSMRSGRYFGKKDLQVFNRCQRLTSDYAYIAYFSSAYTYSISGGDSKWLLRVRKMYKLR